MIFLDTETCGLTGPAIIIQYAYDDGPTTIHNFWLKSVGESMFLLESLTKETVVGFNLVFDWFQINKLYNMFELYLKRGGNVEDTPILHINALAELEADARMGSCLKPKDAVDLMLVARKTKYQITMDRSDIRIKRVPSILAEKLANYLEEQVTLDKILFARRKDKYAPKWRIFPTKDEEFKDIVLKFKPSVALKALAIDALGVDPNELLLFSDVEVNKKFHPNELKYAPFAKAVRDFVITQKNKGTKTAKRINKYISLPWRWAWPDVIEHHIQHWEYNEKARTYAGRDIQYTRDLFRHFGNPTSSDDDVLACMVGSARWRGYTIDLVGLNNLKQEAELKVKRTPIAPRAVKKYLSTALDDSEQSYLTKGTGKLILQELASWKNKECPICSLVGVDKDCPTCKGENLYTHPVSELAKSVLDARLAKKEIEMCIKLLNAQRFHASFKVIGTLSSRMSGTDDLNAQGIKRDKYVRHGFTFSNDPTIDCLVGGDFDGFEVVIAEAAYKDPKLREALTTKATCPGCKGTGEDKKTQGICKDCNGEGKTGQKIHGLFAMELFPGVTYEEVVASKGSAMDMYDYGKRGVFSQVYGGNENTLVNKLGVSLEVATRASVGFLKRYPKMGEERERINNMFCSMRQPNGIGTKVEWHEPADYISSLLGFKRYFTLENKVCGSLFRLANKLPDDWKKLGSKVKVVRRDRVQTASGAICSALYSSAFQIQAANMRAAANHVIQSTGAQITKSVQRKIWDIQPAGVNKWLVQPCNIHDEILCVADLTVKDLVKETVNAAVESFRPTIPLIKMEWHNMQTWADK